MKNKKDITSRYEARGVSSTKTDVHNAIARLPKGLYPGAFCKILPDVLGEDPNLCNIQHADGAGTKAGLAYLWWKLHNNDLGVWKGVLLDSLYMNVDDVGCCGCVGPFLVTLLIDRNKAQISGDVISEIINSCQEACEMLSELGVPCVFSGGETADVGDLTRTITINNVVTVRFSRTGVIDAGRIDAPAVIVGFSSTGKARWETVENSGMGSNGLTNARHDLLAPGYRQFVETYAPETDRELVYCGEYSLDTFMPGLPQSVGSALLSTTRTYTPLMAKLFEAVGRRNLLGLIHCSGGGQTKAGNFGRPGIRYVKENLFPVPPLFALLKKARGLPWREMFSSYSMGHRLEAVVQSEEIARDCIAVAKECGIEAQVVGEVVRDKRNPNGRSVSIKSGRRKAQVYRFKV